MSSRLRYILIGFGILAVALVIFFLLLNPMRADISELETQKQDEEAKIGQLTVQLKTYENLRDAGKRNQGRILELAKMMPDRSEIPSLIIQVQYLADQAGIDVIQITPGQPLGSENIAYQTMTFSLTFTGTFYDVVDFMDRAENMVGGPGRLLTVKNVSLAPQIVAGASSTRSPELSVSMSLLAFVLPTP